MLVARDVCHTFDVEFNLLREREWREKGELAGSSGLSRKGRVEGKVRDVAAHRRGRHSCRLDDSLSRQKKKTRLQQPGSLITLRR